MAGPIDPSSRPGVVTANQSGAAPLTVFAAPATGDEFNTLGERLVPKACFKVEDLLFEFGSSFIRPELEYPERVRKNERSIGAGFLSPRRIFVSNGE